MNENTPVGTPVWYHPIINLPQRYAANTATAFWPLGHGELVCHIDLDPEDIERYQADMKTDRTRIHAARLVALKPRGGV